MRYKLLFLVLLLEILLVSTATVHATDLRGGVVGSDQSPLVAVGVALFAVKQDGTFGLVRRTATGPDGKYYFNAISAGRYVLQIGGTNYQLEVHATQSQDIPVIPLAHH